MATMYSIGKEMLVADLDAEVLKIDQLNLDLLKYNQGRAAGGIFLANSEEDEKLFKRYFNIFYDELCTRSIDDKA